MKNRYVKGGALGALLAVSAISGAQAISVTVDGNPVQFRGQGPVYQMGRVLVPLRGVLEEMGANVRWQSASQTVRATRGDKDVMLRIGDRNATIDGERVTLDVPATIINGSTMVPIRFLSEGLGASVTWNSQQRMVMIDAMGEGRAQPINDRDRDWNNQNRDRDWNRDRDRNRNRDRDRDDRIQDRTELLRSDTVIPVRLDTRLSSNESREGDRFTASVRTDNSTYYGFLPAGARVEGRVVAARPQSGKDPGVIELEFERLRMPNGRSYDIAGQLISLDNNSVNRDTNGRITAKGGSNADNRTVYAGYGAGAGLIVGLLTKRPLEGGLIGGILGYLAGEAQRSNRQPSEVRLNPGTEFGVRLTNDLAINLRDIR